MPLRHVIVIDPGHGGDDPGARGPQARVEKAVTLQMAMALTAKLKNHRGAKKVQIVLTRNEDLDLDLTTRTAIANHHRAALFISLHWTHVTARPMPDLALFVHRPAEANPRYSPESTGSLSLKDQASTLWEAVQTPHFMRSREAAQSIATAVNDRIAACDCRIYEAPLAALQGANMPAVLIEIDSAGPPPQNTNLSLEPGVDSILGAVAEGVYAFLANRYKIPSHK